MKFVFAFLWGVRFLPIPLLHLLAELLGTLAWIAARERRRVGMVNVGLCFPELTLGQRRRLVRANFVQMLRLMLEYGICWYASAERIQKLVKLKNLDYVTDLREAGHDVIVFYPHFTAFEMGCFRLNQDLPLVSVYSHQKNAELDAAIYRHRQRYDNVKIVSRQESLRSIIKAMKADHTPFLYLPDQDFGPRDSLFVKFFNTDAATIPGLARIARLANARVVPAIARRVGFRFEVEFYPAWDNFPSDDVVADTRRMNAFLEDRIRECPEQYFWLHKRFKTRPEGEARFY
ncbi:lipid A biosynthesis lauroyl acyltransferase [Crenobacter cavernae]|uniref:Lipid A biosynthesis lauroyl acyltransferase n=1 Tax=Crenobacter cavernae TaxID=2290923 RepID=A0ABY0FEY3_9NEIS|nr:lipid A biosynthesis lauroyl acyltransferase [Crenobacter cavernae]RXZ44861.1 lipid A biosynthesis lauroyl acyltransferase [Crenobacter cavernae]